MFLELTFVFCASFFRDVPLEIAKDTTCVTSPLTEDGRVDYFRALELKLYPKNMKTDANGYRLLVRKLGPFVDPNDKNADILTKQAYEKLGLDPATKPTLTYEEPLECLLRYTKSQQEKKTGDKGDGFEDAWALESKVHHPWTLETLPMMGEWLKKNGPALDVLAEAVRKPVYFRPVTRADDKTDLIGLLLPDIQQTRSFARGLSARANYRIGTGQIDKAIDDIITIKRLGRHAGQQITLVDALVGIAIEGIGNATNLAGSLDHQPTEAQLKRFGKELRNLPPRATFQKSLFVERCIMLHIIQSLARKKELTPYTMFCGFRKPDPIIAELSRLPGFDWNIVARRINWYYDHLDEVDWPTTEMLFVAQNLTLGFLSPETRSEMLANHLARFFLSANKAAQEAFRRAECSDHLQKITLAMLLYEKDHGRLPPAYTVDKNGKPLHSWRVLLLPYLGEETKKLYGQIRLDEPWDSPHNKKFHTAAVEFYQCPSAKLEPGQTTYSVVVGKKTAFQPREGKKLDQLGPNSATMVLVLENHTSCNWMAPTSNLTETDAKEVLQKETVHPGTIMTGLRGGGIWSIWEAIDPEKFQKGLEGTDRNWLNNE